MTVNSPVNVNVSYHFVKPARLISNPNKDFDDLLTAYSQATENDTIQSREYIFSAALTLDQPKNVIFNGGFDLSYLYPVDYTTIVGKLTVTKGKLTATRLIVR